MNLKTAWITFYNHTKYGVFGDFGNVFTQGLRACIQNKRYQCTKKMLQGLSATRKDIPCCRCGTYQKMLKQNIFPDLTENKSSVKKIILKQLFKPY
ncbi:MAG: hypothetical protein K8S27_10220 [Candidatus Omnitrophica bacterium]|nr:hypothetical protein [Candidatus Omnitrophota bacterium]